MTFETPGPWLPALILTLIFGLAVLAHALAAPDRIPARAAVRLDRPDGR